MSTQILMPALSPTMTEGNLARWLKKEGDKIKAGDVIAEIETDKATMEVEAVDEGTLGKILIAEGAQGVAVNTPIAVLLEEGESVSDAGAPITDIPCIPNAVPKDDNAPAMQTSTAAQPAGKDIKNRDILYAQGSVIEPPVFDEAKFMANTATLTVRTRAKRLSNREYARTSLHNIASAVRRRGLPHRSVHETRSGTQVDHRPYTRFWQQS